MSKAKVKELQGKLETVNRMGSIMVGTCEENEGFRALIDSFIILEFYKGFALALWKGIGYHLDSGCIKSTLFTFKPDEVSTTKAHGEQWFTFDLEDDLGRTYRVEAISSITDGEEHATWVKWVKYKKSRAKLFRDIDRSMIEDWPDVAVTL